MPICIKDYKSITRKRKQQSRKAKTSSAFLYVPGQRTWLCGMHVERALRVAVSHWTVTPVYGQSKKLSHKQQTGERKTLPTFQTTELFGSFKLLPQRMKPHGKVTDKCYNYLVLKVSVTNNGELLKNIVKNGSLWSIIVLKKRIISNSNIMILQVWRPIFNKGVLPLFSSNFDDHFHKFSQICYSRHNVERHQVRILVSDNYQRCTVLLCITRMRIITGAWHFKRWAKCERWALSLSPQ